MSALYCPLCGEEAETGLLLGGRPAAECTTKHCHLQWIRLPVQALDALCEAITIGGDEMCRHGSITACDECADDRGTAQLAVDLAGGGPTLAEQQDSARGLK